MKVSCFLSGVVITGAIANAAIVYTTLIEYVTVARVVGADGSTSYVTISDPVPTPEAVPIESVQQEWIEEVKPEPEQPEQPEQPQQPQQPAEQPAPEIVAPIESEPVAQPVVIPEPQPEPQPQKQQSLGGFADEILGAHNSKRSLHGVPSLLWDGELASYAESVASSYDCSGSLTHTGAPYGENLGAGYSSPSAVVDAWYNEINGYNFKSNQYNHFTQVIWKSTTKLGCAQKDCRGNNWGYYTICVYSPAGNMMGQFSENVVPPL